MGEQAMMNDEPQPIVAEVILPLTSTGATLERAGGKGANLAALTRAGFDVPPGFVVGTDAYRTFVAANGIEPRLLELVRAISPEDPASLDATSQSIRALFGAGRMPAGSAAAIQAAYAQLPSNDSKPVPVAVRSSATAEDLPGLSFAGQQDTYLNVVGPVALCAAIQSCWASLWTARALGYRARNGIAPEGIALAVVVQAMIMSEVSGVLFTANPLTGHRGESVIDASFGLGEAIVSGQVEPDHYVVDRRTLQIKSRKLGAKALAVVPLGAGGTQSIARAGASQQALPDAQIVELARVAEGVAEHFGAPQDIEWAWAGGRLYLLQSRPITSLYPLPDSITTAEPLRVLFSFNAIQGIVDPLTPLGLSLFPPLIGGMLKTVGLRRSGSEVLLSAGGRLYIDVTDTATDPRLREAWLFMLTYGDPGAKEAAQGLFASGRIATRRVAHPVNFLRLALGLRPVVERIPLTLLRPVAMRAHCVSRTEEFMQQALRDFQAATTLPARLAVIDQYAATTMRQVILRLVPAMAPGIIGMGLVSKWLAAWTDAEPGAMRKLLRGLPGNPTTEMDLKLWATAQAIRADVNAKAALLDSAGVDVITHAYLAGSLPAAAQRAIQGFLDQYGMRASGEIDPGRSRWREDPRAIIQTLISYLQIDDPDLAPDAVFRRAGAEAEKLAAQYVDNARQRKGWLRARLLSAMIRRMRLLAGLREAPKFYMVRMLDLVRTAMLDSGRELAASGMLKRAEDICFVPLDTLRNVAAGKVIDLKPIVQHARAEYERELARRRIPRLLLSTGEAFYAGVGQSAGSAEAGVLVGDGVSPGMVEGTVRVVLDPRGARLEPGEILVCPATDPGWTPLFLSAGGLVMELGGMITHGSVVARELGIPAVVGVHEVTQRLKTGQRIRVDGSTGRVVIL
jgi:rifampicin phosphotransferase